MFKEITSSPLAVCVRKALFIGAASSVLLLAQGCNDSAIDSPEFALQLDPVSKTLISMKPKNGEAGFDFLPFEHQENRTGDGYYQLGDIDIRLRQSNTSDWQDFSSALHYGPVEELVASSNLNSADISADLGDIPLTVVRDWVVEDGHLLLKFTLKNNTTTDYEIGGLGLPMVFDNVVSGRELDEAHQKASYAEAYMGEDAGYVQVVRLNGQGPALLVTPEENAPLKVWKPILDEVNPDETPKIYNDPTHRTHTFEGFYDWMIFSKGFADNEWQGKPQWNTPTSLTLSAGETYTTSVRFSLAPSVREVEQTLVEQSRPVAVGLPGYVVPTDLPARLLLKAPSEVKTIDITPANALTLTEVKGPNGWKEYAVKGNQWGQSRVTLTYADNSTQTIHYFVTEPMRKAVSTMGDFLFNQQWFEGENDPFKRGPSVMSYDNETQSIVLQDQRVWIAGLSDEGGAGSWLAAVMKQLGQPDADEINKVMRFYDEVIDGRLQYTSGDNQFGVKKSLFYYDPEALPDYDYDQTKDWTTWASWNKEAADSVVRSFNYVHVAAAQWVLYKLARFHQGLVTNHDWQWYLKRACDTSIAMVELAPTYVEFGQMEGDVFVEILNDLYAENMLDDAKALEAVMRKRAEHWASLAYPFGSEMPWDSTGQEEVYAWMRYFDKTPQAEQTREVILGYDFTLPHWGYNGSARRFWDFLYAGKNSRIERQLHHYGSSINAIPLLDSYRRNPDDFYLLRVGYGGMMGSLTNIDEKGFASAAFHSFPDYMDFDPYTGDYGSSFFGHAYEIGSYAVDHPEFGWVGFGAQVQDQSQHDAIIITPKDTFATRMYIAPAKLWLQLDAGKFEQVVYHPSTGSVDVSFAGATQYTNAAMLKIMSYGAQYAVDKALPVKAGRHEIALSSTGATVTLKR